MAAGVGAALARAKHRRNDDMYRKKKRLLATITVDDALAIAETAPFGKQAPSMKICKRQKRAFIKV